MNGEPDKTLMPFGRYKHVPLSDVPAEYLDWLLRSTVKIGAGLRRAVVGELESRFCCGCACGIPRRSRA